MKLKIYITQAATAEDYWDKFSRKAGACLDGKVAYLGTVLECLTAAGGIFDSHVLGNPPRSSASDSEISTYDEKYIMPFQKAIAAVLKKYTNVWPASVYPAKDVAAFIISLSAEEWNFHAFPSTQNRK